MKISYELNPPKILDSRFDYQQLERDLDIFRSRVKQLKVLVDNIHITDSVLGVPRLSSITLAKEFDIRARCSIRVRDRNFMALLQLITDAALAKIDGVLIVKGDNPKDNSRDSGLKPTQVVRDLNKLGFNRKIKLFLSIPSNASKSAIEKKVEVEPYGLITQTISSIENLITIHDIAKAHKIKVLPCIMIPSEKNRKSAERIGLNWDSYINDPYSFIRHAYDICGEVLMTSPMSFDDGLNTVRRLVGC